MRWITVPLFSIPIVIAWGMYSIGGNLMGWSSFMLVIVTGILAIFTGSMVFYIKEQVKGQSLDNRKRISIESMREIRAVFNRLERDGDFTHIINSMADYNEKKIPSFPTNEPRIKDNINFFYNELSALAILWDDDIVLTSHIDKSFGLMFKNMSEIPDMMDHLDVEINGKKPYEDLSRLIKVLINN